MVCGYALAYASIWLESPFLLSFLSENLIVVLIALMAINTTTGSVVMTKLREITDKNKVDFSRTIKELRLSLLEQVWYIAFALVASMLYSSAKLHCLVPWPELTIGGVLSAVFIASMNALHDTARSIFVILKHENKMP